MNHRLNLCVADTCSLALVSTMMNVVRALSDFFKNSPKRQQCLIDKIRELLLNNNHRVLIDVCRTRWISRIDGMDRIVELLPAIISLLEDNTLNSDIQVDENTTIGNWNLKSRNDAQNLINAVTLYRGPFWSKLNKIFSLLIELFVLAVHFILLYIYIVTFCRAFFSLHFLNFWHILKIIFFFLQCTDYFWHLF